MTSEDWKEYKEDSKKMRLAKCQNAELDLAKFLRDMPSLFMVKVQDWHFRIGTSNNKVLDIFPGTRKYHNLVNNTRGTYRDLITFLKDFEWNL